MPKPRKRKNSEFQTTLTKKCVPVWESEQSKMPGVTADPGFIHRTGQSGYPDLK